MSRVEKVYRWLASDLKPEANHALAAALEHAEQPYAARIARILADRRHETAWSGLVANCDKLEPELKSRLRSRPELVRAGIAGAIKSRTARARQNALLMLREFPCAHLTYLAADALRDASPDVRAAATNVLRGTAERILDEAAASEGAAAPTRTAERVELVRALREALRTYEIHGQRELLEVSLWFAKDIGEALWDALAGPRSRCGPVVEHHLESWNHARLAGFLLLALGQPSWRPAALTLLDSWTGRDELIAILRCGDLLGDPRFREGLRHLKRAPWLAAARSLADLPADARGQLPLWVCHLGFSITERLRCLQRWLTSSLPEVHRAAVYALASLNTPDTTQLLVDVGTRPGPMNRFARWFVIGNRVMSENARRSPARGGNLAGATSHQSGTRG